MPKKGKIKKISKNNAYSRYKAENRHHKNKVKALTKHVKKYPGDVSARERLIKLVEVGVTPYTRNRRADKPNETIQKVIRRITQFNTYYKMRYPRLEPKKFEVLANKED